MLNIQNMEQVAEGPINNKQRTKKSKKFQRLIISYNNMLFFYSKSANMDHKNSAWATFKAMGRVKHLMDLLFPEKSNRQCFY